MTSPLLTERNLKLKLKGRIKTVYRKYIRGRIAVDGRRKRRDCRVKRQVVERAHDGLLLACMDGSASAPSKTAKPVLGLTAPTQHVTATGIDDGIGGIRSILLT